MLLTTLLAGLWVNQNIDDIKDAIPKVIEDLREVCSLSLSAAVPGSSHLPCNLSHMSCHSPSQVAHDPRFLDLQASVRELYEGIVHHASDEDPVKNLGDYVQQYHHLDSCRVLTNSMLRSSGQRSKTWPLSWECCLLLPHLLTTQALETPQAINRRMERKRPVAVAWCPMRDGQPNIQWWDRLCTMQRYEFVVILHCDSQVLIPGFVTSGLELWQGQSCAKRHFRLKGIL